VILSNIIKIRQHLTE